MTCNSLKKKTIVFGQVNRKLDSSVRSLVLLKRKGVVTVWTSDQPTTLESLNHEILHYQMLHSNQRHDVPCVWTSVAQHKSTLPFFCRNPQDVTLGLYR